MADILLSSEKRIKAVTNISDNVAGKYILAALRQAQEVGLREFLGDCLLDRLKVLATPDPETHDRPIDQQENAAYKDLVDRAQDYLAWASVAEVCNMVTNKVANFGVAKTSDENLQPVGTDDLGKQQYYYQAKADSSLRLLQRWIRANDESFPELDGCACTANGPELLSSASCGMWLGGPRGRRLPGGGGCCR